MAQKKNRRNAIIAALAVLVVALAVGGTIAWLTATDQLTNTFTVGSIDKPGHPSEPDEGDDGDEKEDSSQSINGYLFETTWVDKTELTKGVATPKNPNVGVGKGDTENPNNAFVFLYVENKSLQNSLMTEPNKNDNLAAYAPYFYLEKQWRPVESDQDVKPVESEYGNKADVITSAGRTNQKAYVNGLFMYTATDDCTTLATAPVALTPANSTATASNSTAMYTGELFEDITVPNDLGKFNVSDVLLDNGTIEVHAFIYAANGEDAGDGSASQALTEAIAWAKKIANPESGE